MLSLNPHEEMKPNNQKKIMTKRLTELKTISNPDTAVKSVIRLLTYRLKYEIFIICNGT